MKCSICGSENLKIIRDKLRYNIIRNVLKCQNCGIVFLEPKKVSEGYYQKEYTGSYGPILGKKVTPKESFDIYLANQKPRIEKIKSFLNPEMKVLDIGCSAGQFLYSIKDSVKECVGIELNQEEAEFTEKELGFRVYKKPIQEITEFEPESFDMITFFHVFEHIENPMEFLKEVYKYLKPNGILVVEVPNMNDPLIALYDIKEYSDFWFREPHVFYHSPKTLSMILEKAGFVGEIQTSQNFNLINHINWILNKAPQKDNKEQSGSILVRTNSINPKIKQEFNEWFEKINKQYKELLNKFQLGENLFFIGKKIQEPEIKIGNRQIGKFYKPFVIAEIGINHNGDINKAKQMIKDAYDSGAECIKFQMHIIEDEMAPIAKQVIPGHTKESIWDIMKSCALSVEEHIELKKYCEELGLIYLCTPFSRVAADKLNEMNVQAFKIGSGECNNYPLIEHIVNFGKPVILSTGMNNMENIKKAVNVLEKKKVPYALLHCTSLYPTPYEKIRLEALLEMKKEFPNAVIGLSDHSISNYPCFGAVTLGASILEKHFTSDKTWQGPDIALSIDPKELNELITGTDAVHKSLKGKKEILSEEQPTIDFAYASIVSIKDIKRGEVLTKENIWVKRPGKGGILAEEFPRVLGKIARQDIPKDKQLLREDFE